MKALASSGASSLRLSLPARVLLGLERWFTPLTGAPREGGQIAQYEYAKAQGSFAELVEEIGGLAGKRVLDFGCGWGGETLWLAQQAALAVGCDIELASLQAAQRFMARSGQRNVLFVPVRDNRLPLPNDTFDAVLSTNVFEHVMEPEAAFAEICRVLKPGGRFLSRFGPLFHSPLGYHVPWATQVPYAHLIFGLGPIVELCRLKRGPLQADTWQDMGLNGLTFGQLRRAACRAGLEVVRFRRVPVRRLTLLAALPVVGDLFTFGVDCHLRKPL